MCLRLEVLKMQVVGRPEVYEICGRRRVYREVVQAGSNYITAWGDSIGSNRIEKDQIHVHPRIVRGQGEKRQCNVIYYVWSAFRWLD